MTNGMKNDEDDQEKLVDKIVAYEMLASQIGWTDDYDLKSILDRLKSNKALKIPYLREPF